MMEDFWLPRREGGKGTEIDTLPGGQNLGELEDVKYFEKKLYKALSVPVSRLNPETSGFSLGRSNEITRDELKFSKFVDRLRNRFSDLFDQALKVQCILKGICTKEEWEEFRENITYDFIKDNNFKELKEAELMKERLGYLQLLDVYTGRYFSQTWIQRNVLRFTDDEIKTMQEEMDEEKEAGLGLPVGVTNDVAQAQLMAQVPSQPTHPDDIQAQQDLAAAQAKQSSTNEEKTFHKLKRIL